MIKKINYICLLASFLFALPLYAQELLLLEPDGLAYSMEGELVAVAPAPAGGSCTYYWSSAEAPNGGGSAEEGKGCTVIDCNKKENKEVCDLDEIEDYPTLKSVDVISPGKTETTFYTDEKEIRAYLKGKNN